MARPIILLMLVAVALIAASVQSDNHDARDKSEFAKRPFCNSWSGCTGSFQSSGHIAPPSPVKKPFCSPWGGCTGSASAEVAPMAPPDKKPFCGASPGCAWFSHPTVKQSQHHRPCSSGRCQSAAVDATHNRVQINTINKLLDAIEFFSARRQSLGADTGSPTTSIVERMPSPQVMSLVVRAMSDLKHRH